MPPVDAHAMVDHCVLDLVDDSCPGSLNAQSFFHLGKARSEQRQPLQGATPLLLLLLPDKHKASPALFPTTHCCAIVGGRESKRQGQVTVLGIARVQRGWYLIGVIRSGSGAFHTMGGHDCTQVVTFY